MLSHQRWPYVGRFARGWHRLPGRIPGQPQTRTRARLRIGSRGRAAQRRSTPRDRACGRDRVDLPGAGLEQDVGGRRERRARREDVVNEQDARRRGAGGPEDAVHRHPALGPRAPCLGCGRDRPAELSPRGTPGSVGDRDGERARLVVPALRAASACQRYPRDNVDIGHVARARDRICERGGDVSPSGKFQTQDRPARRPVVDERRAHRRQRRRRAVLACGLRTVGRVAAAFTPRRLDRPQPRRALGAERPRTCAAARARPGEQRVDHPDHDRATIAATTDTTRYGSGTSTDGSSVIWMVKVWSDRSTG